MSVTTPRAARGEGRGEGGRPSARRPRPGAGGVRARCAAALRTPPPPLWTIAALLVLGEALLALAGVHSAALSAVALIAPGLALVPLLPPPIRRHPLSAIVVAPALGMAVSSVVLITLARVGITLTATSVRVALIVLVAIALPTWDTSTAPDGATEPGAPDAATEPDAPDAATEPDAPVARGPDATPRLSRPGRGDVLEGLGLLAILVLGAALALRVVGTGTTPGNDWAKYLLYAQEIARHGALLIRNPYWMLGQPFRDDPGVPSLYGSILILAHAPASELVHGILAFALLEIAAVYALGRALGGPIAGLVAAALIAVVPASQDILGWAGVANLAALVELALLIAYLAAFVNGSLRDAGADAGSRARSLDVRATVGLAVTLLGVLAAHRLSGVIGLALTGIVLLGCCASPARRRRAWRDAVLVAGVTLVLGAGVLADLIARERTFGGSLPYTDYLGTKLDLSLAWHDLSPLLVVATLVALLAFAVRQRRSHAALWVPIALLVIVAALAYGWVVHVPNYYERMTYYVPLAVAPLVGAMAASLVGATAGRARPRWLLAAVGAAALALTVNATRGEDANIASYYSFATPASLRGLAALSAVLRPNEVVVTDSCWSFLAPWLLQTRTLAGLEPQDIQPAAELPFADEARAILAGSARGRALARELGVRYLVVDPICPGPNGTALAPPPGTTPVYESERLAILRLPAGG